MPARSSERWAAISLVSIAALAAQQNADDLWSASVRRAEELDAQRRFPQAADAAKLALQSAQSFGPMDPRRAIAYFSLGAVYRDWGQCDQSRANLVSEVRIWKQQTNPEAKYVFATLSSLVSEVAECGDPAGAGDLFHTYHGDLQRFRSGPLDDARILLLQGEISRKQRHYRQAELLFRQALQIMERDQGANPARIAEARTTLATVLADLGRTERALAEAQRAVADLEQIDALHPALPSALNTVGCALFKGGRRQEAVRVHQRALGLARTIFGDDSLITAVIMINYAVVLKAVKRPSEAEAMHQQGQDAYRRSSLRQTIDVEELRDGGSAH